MHKTVLHLLSGLWTLLLATIVLISNIFFDNKGKAATPFDILCWCFEQTCWDLPWVCLSVRLTLSSVLKHTTRNVKTLIFFLFSLPMFSKIIKLTLFATCARGTLWSSSSVLLSSQLVLVCSRSCGGSTNRVGTKYPLTTFNLTARLTTWGRYRVMPWDRLLS